MADLADPRFLAPAGRRVRSAQSRPTFSAVIAAYQAAETIGAAVSSALDQDPPPLEVIVCDDGSTDDLAGALAPYGERVRLIRVPHGGPSRARNTAAAAARGDFLALLDADDEWLPGRLDAIGELARLRPDLEIITPDLWFLRGGRRVGRFYDARPFPVVDQRRAILEWCFVHGHSAVRRAAWARVGGYDVGLMRAGDWDLWLRLIHAGAAVGCVAEPFSTYRIWDGSLSGSRAESLQARVLVLERARRLPLSPSERQALDAARAVAVLRAGLAEATSALADGGPGSRGRLLRVAVRPDLPLSLRARTVLAAVAPVSARRLLDHRPGDSSSIDRVLPGE